ncbi:unnamed protein product [Colias eurytheme]|nr:unnamed protein product [Colias eurytheme]
METLNHGYKRKRLRTRKNLDEIRRKCRHQDENPTKNVKSKQGKHLNNHTKMITSQRLTLAFKKAVQSKTVLRSESNVKNPNILDNTKKLLKLGASPTQPELNVESDKCIDLDEHSNNSPSILNSMSENEQMDTNFETGRTFVSHIMMNENNNNAQLTVDHDVESNESDVAQEIFDYISQHIIPDVNGDEFSPGLENYNNYLREKYKIQNKIRTSPELRAFKNDELSVTDQHVDESISLSEDSPIFKEEILSIVDKTPEFTYYPHKLNH